MQLPIRIRLSLSYFAIFSVAGILLCVAAYLMARQSLYFALDHELGEHIDDVHDYLAARGLSNDYARARAAVKADFELKDEGKWLQIQDGQGRWIYRARRMMIAPHALPPASALPRTGSIFEFAAGPKRVRSMRRAFSLNGRTFVVETGSALTKTDRTLVRFRDGLWLISPIVLLMAGIAGHLVSRRALSPVAAIAREAQRIHDGNLQTRLPQLHTRDELAHLSTTLNEMLGRIESGVRSVRDFTAYASHELRTPVAFIRTEADLALQYQRSNQEYREAIEVIRAEAQRMSSLIDSLLFLARTDAGTEQAQLRSVDARRLCIQACEKSRSLMLNARLQLKSDLPADALPVMADPQYLQRLLAIVLENAVRYTLPGGLVRLTLRVVDDRAHFEVADSGIGIPTQDRAYIFDRFRRGSNAQNVNAHGSGLGLALAAWIAERHQTEIQVDSTPGAGSAFSWTLAMAPEYWTDASLDKMAASETYLPLASLQT